MKKATSTLTTAGAWGARFVQWYNNEHRHSGIGYVTPAQRHAGEDHGVLEARHELYTRARRQPAALVGCDAQLDTAWPGDAES